MNRRYNIPSLESRQILLPGTGVYGKNICDDIDDKVDNRIKELKKAGILPPWYKFW